VGLREVAGVEVLQRSFFRSMGLFASGVKRHRGGWFDAALGGVFSAGQPARYAAAE
jgi:hypothetical protein